MNSRDRGLWNMITENGSYKMVAFVVALVLWVTMQGRKDTVLSRDMEMQVLLGPNLAITNPIPQVVKVEISGPRIALKKMGEKSTPFTVDLGNAKPGRHMVRLTKEGLNLPIGAKVLSIQPEEFLAVIVEMVPRKQGDDGVEK